MNPAGRIGLGFLCAGLLGLAILLWLARKNTVPGRGPLAEATLTSVRCVECDLPMQPVMVNDALPNVQTDVRKKGHLQIVYVCPYRHVGLLPNESTSPYR